MMDSNDSTENVFKPEPEMTTVLVFGAYGLLGSSLCEELVRDGHFVRRQGRAAAAEVRIDPSDTEAVKEVLLRHRTDVIVNLVAATNVDECEIDPQGAYRANVRVVQALVDAINACPHDSAPHLVQISTDQVYDGPGPHEESTVDPCNVYALSKLAGEFVASQVGATVLRTNFFGRSRCTGRASLSDWIISSLRAGQHITVFDDVFFSALHIDTLCGAIGLAIRKRQPGTFNLGCQYGSSKASLALGLAKRLELDSGLMTLGSAREAKFRARRPLDMRLDSSRFERIFGFAAPSFETQIDLTAQEHRYEQTAT